MIDAKFFALLDACQHIMECCPVSVHCLTSMGGDVVPFMSDLWCCYPLIWFM